MNDKTKPVKDVIPAMHPGDIVQPDQPLTVIDQNPYVQMIAVAAARDVDIEKLEKLMDLQERWEDRQALGVFVNAMATVQKNIQPVIADAENKQTNSRYSKLSTIVSALAPIYTAEGFSVSFGTEDCASQKLIDGGWFRTSAELSHIGGHTKYFHIDLPADTTGAKGTVNKTVIHGMKSAITYARVILMGLMFNFTTTQDIDDDGNSADIQYITERQTANLRDDIAALPGAKEDDEAVFCTFLKIDSLEDMPARMHPKALMVIADQKREAGK